MNRIVEKGKTLLVEGPASVVVISGKVEVFGSPVRTNKIVIREGKRLPFAVEETATFEISSGESASVEEAEGNTVPSSWIKSSEELMSLQVKPPTAMVLGTIDSGKTSFCTYMVNRLLSDTKKRIAILDGDLGQSDVGPPCTVAYTFVTKPITDLFNLDAKNAIFVGVTSPSMATDKVVEGLKLLKEEILACNPDFLVINTDGWIEGEDAANYKVKLVAELNPDIIFCIQQKDELTPLLNALSNFRKTIVDSPPLVRQRSREKRRSLRELGYIKYLKNSKVQSFPFGWLKVEGDEIIGLGKTRENVRYAKKIYELLGMKPLNLTEQQDRIYVIIGRRRWINPDNVKKVEEHMKKKVIVIKKGEEEGLLTAFYDSEKKFLGVGILQEVDYTRKTLKILTPVSEEIATIAIGRVKLDKNMKEIPTISEENQLNFARLRKFF